jgi:hypothetical protein
MPGIGLGATNNEVLLSWSEETPLSKSLRTGSQISVLAYYETEFGPVTNELLDTAKVLPGIPGVKLKLPNSLKRPPIGKICLKLVSGRNTIPVRIPNYSESSDGFYYNEWAHNAKIDSEKSVLQRDSDFRAREISRIKEPDSNFESWRQKNNLTNANQCGSITVTDSLDKPSTALSGQQKLDASKQQCVFLYRNFWRKKFGKDRELYSPNELEKFTPRTSPYYSKVTQFQDDYNKFGDGREYFAESNFPMDSSAIKTLRSGKNKEVTVRIIVEAYDNCLIEAETRFDDSVRNWKKIMEGTQSSVEPLQHLCRARFERNSARKNLVIELKQEKTDIDNAIKLLNTAKRAQLPIKKPLVNYACPVSS